MISRTNFSTLAAISRPCDVILYSAMRPAPSLLKLSGNACERGVARPPLDGAGGRARPLHRDLSYESRQHLLVEKIADRERPAFRAVPGILDTAKRCLNVR